MRVCIYIWPINDKTLMTGNSQTAATLKEEFRRVSDALLANLTVKLYAAPANFAFSRSA